MKEKIEELKIPFWEKYTLTIPETARYFGIGETKLREYLNANPTAKFVFKNGNKTLIKRKMFEKIIDENYVL